MTKRILVLFPLLFLLLFVEAQSDIDSLKSSLRAAEGSYKVDILNQLASMNGRKDHRLAWIYATRALRLADSLNYLEGLGKRIGF